MPGASPLMRWAAALRQPGRWRRDPMAWFLACWLLLELLGYTVLTPFPAVRRTLGLGVVAALLTTRLASRTCRITSRRPLVLLACGCSVLLALLVQGIDVMDAACQRDAVREAARRIRAQDPTARIWYVGHWGFQYYAEEAGMEPIVPVAPPPSLLPLGQRSFLRSGNWLVLPDPVVVQQSFLPDPARTVLVDTVVQDDPIPLRTVICYYGGRTALERKVGARLTVEIRKVVADHPAELRPEPP